MEELPSDYNFDWQIFSLAKMLGQSEDEIKEQYTYTETVERNLFGIHENYVDRELMPKK